MNKEREKKKIKWKTEKPSNQPTKLCINTPTRIQYGYEQWPIITITKNKKILFSHQNFLYRSQRVIIIIVGSAYKFLNAFSIIEKKKKNLLLCDTISKSLMVTVDTQQKNEIFSILKKGKWNKIHLFAGR